MRPRRKKIYRKRPSHKERYAALLCEMKTADGEYILDQKKIRMLGVTADDIIDLFEGRGKNKLREWDHASQLAVSESNHPANFWPAPVEVHKEKTKRDAAARAKGRKIAKRQAEHERMMALRFGGAKIELEKIETEFPEVRATREQMATPRRKSRPIPGSRNTPFKKKLDGTVLRR